MWHGLVLEVRNPVQRRPDTLTDVEDGKLQVDVDFGRARVREPASDPVDQTRQRAGWERGGGGCAHEEGEGGRVREELRWGGDTEERRQLGWVPGTKARGGMNQFREIDPPADPAAILGKRQPDSPSHLRKLAAHTHALAVH